MSTSAATATSNNSILEAYLKKQAQNIAADQTASSSSSSSSSSTASSSSTSSTSATSVFKNESTFLNILTTQLKNQDPTNTTDTNAFTQELVQFAQVEQQLNTNTDLQSLISLQKASSGVTAALGYVGQYVEVPTTTGQLSLQNGSAEFAYNLPSTAQNVTITVKDSSGNTVTTLTGTKTSGLNYVTWNGQNSSGTQQSDGAYTFSVAATDTSGKTETISDTRFLGKVTGVTSNSDGTTNLSIGTISVGTSTVDAVYNSSNLPTATVS